MTTMNIPVLDEMKAFVESHRARRLCVGECVSARVDPRRSEAAGQAGARGQTPRGAPGPGG